MIPNQVQKIAEGRVVKPSPYVGYYVTDDGSVISTFVHGSNKRRISPDAAREIRPQLSKNGYRVVFIWRDGASRSTYVHRIVLESFVGPAPAGCEACHNDGDRQNNTIQNLRWDTRKANHSDSVAHHTHRVPPRNKVRGERNGQARFTEAAILSIRGMARNGISQSRIGAVYGVKQQTISDIVRRRSWAWLE
jgi:hypothetical protein